MKDEQSKATPIEELDETQLEADQNQAESTEEVDQDETDQDAVAEDVETPESAASKKAVLMNEGEVAADYLEELLDIADLDGDIDTFIESGRARVSILTDSDLLVGKEGAVLEALQELSRLAVMTETGKRSRLMLDIGGYREKRRKELQEMAADAVLEVQQSGESVRLVAMNPFERKIVHDVVADSGLVSESEGVEPNRRVVVMPA